VDDFYWLDQIQSSDRPLVGDKAFYLGYLAQRGYSVIPGFVISVRAFQQFLETIDWLEPLFSDLPNSSLHLDVNNAQQLQSIAQQIRQSIQAAPLASDWLERVVATAASFESSTLILRPSLTVQPLQAQPTSVDAVRGLLETQICWNEPQAIAQGLKQLWAELFRARSLFYWQSYGIQLHQIRLAVLVQPLCPAVASGTLRTKVDLFEVRSTWGLGMALKQGEVTPDFYQIRAEVGVIQTQKLGTKTLAYQVAGLGGEVPGTHFQFAESVSSSLPSLEFEPQLTVPTPALLATENACLQPYLLDEFHQKQFALEDEELQELTRLAQALVAELGTTLLVEWLLAPAQDEIGAKVYLTQVSPYTAISLEENDRQPTSDGLETIAVQQKVVTGLAAAAGRTIAKAQVLTHHSSNIQPGSILVIRSITPDGLLLLKQAAGVIAEQGGMTSHGAIVARELGIPAIVGAANATHLIQSGEYVLLDGDRGEVYRIEPGKNLPLKEGAGSGKIGSDSLEKSLKPLQNPFFPSSTFSPPMIATQLMVNLSQPELLAQIAEQPIDGVGLLRSELVLATLGQDAPQLRLQSGHHTGLVDCLAKQVSLFAEAFFPRPVFYRSLDLRSHEFNNLLGRSSHAETNPVLGLRGTLSYQYYPEIFEVELAALARVQQDFGNVHLMLPFVRTVEEFQFCQQQVVQAGLRQNPHFQIWIMAEVPSVLFLLPEFVKAGVQGISIGTNDLTQLLLGIDRDHPELTRVIDDRHPAVLKAIAHLIQTAQQCNIPCSICGEAPAQHPELIEYLIQQGISSISVDPSAIHSTYHTIARAEQRLLLKTVRQQYGDRPQIL
jgi:pyruvate, water dikinase